MEVTALRRQFRKVGFFCLFVYGLFVVHLLFSGEHRGNDFGSVLRSELEKLSVQQRDVIERRPGIRPNSANEKRSMMRVSSTSSTDNVIAYYTQELERNGWRKISVGNERIYFCKNDLSAEIDWRDDESRRMVEIAVLWKNNMYGKTGCPGVQSDEWRVKVIGQK